MRISNAGLELIKRWEGRFLKAYHGAADRPGLLTIGYGHTDEAGPPKVTAGLTITQEEADDILRNDLRKVESSVEKLVKVPLTQNQFDVLVSFVFNLGEGTLKKSTLLNKLNNKDYDAVPNEIMKFVNANGVRVQGLVNRRTDEAKMWKSKTLNVKAEDAAIVVGSALGGSIAYNYWDYALYIGSGTVVAVLAIYILLKLYRKGKKNV